jgi:hypothetical protein
MEKPVTGSRSPSGSAYSVEIVDPLTKLNDAGRFKIGGVVSGAAVAAELMAGANPISAAKAKTMVARGAHMIVLLQVPPEGQPTGGSLSSAGAKVRLPCAV